MQHYMQPNFCTAWNIKCVQTSSRYIYVHNMCREILLQNWHKFDEYSKWAVLIVTLDWSCEFLTKKKNLFLINKIPCTSTSTSHLCIEFYLPVCSKPSTTEINIFLNNQLDALIIQIYSVIKLYMFRASSLPIIRSFPLYIRHW